MNNPRNAQLHHAIQCNPRDPALHYELGNLLLEQSQAAAALDSYLAALKLAPRHPQILLQMGNTLSALGRFAEAAARFREALRADPGQPAAHYNLGNALRELGQPEQAVAAYRQALKLSPKDADACNNLGNVLRETGKLDEAMACYREALRLDPALHHAHLHLLHQRQHTCDWQELEADIAEIRRLVREEPRAQISPFAFLSLPGTTAAEQRRCAENWTSNRHAALMGEASSASRPFLRVEKPRLRLGYLSADFRQHPLTSLVTELFELHDRARFETVAYSYGADDRSPARRRLEQAVDRFEDIRTIPQREAAQRIHADGIDILVDLTGYTQTSRSGIMALRPAPIQVSWLGFPGTMGAPFVDYLIADSFIAPPGADGDYSEKLVRLPDAYQPNDRQRPMASTPGRADCGLPENAFVFCCFNQTFKITPQVFDAWMRLLQALPDSVLWLLECNPWAKANLLREAQMRGIGPERLLFAPRVPMDKHLARQRLADLFLDTLPYNAHTTASDALWAGLPVLTCSGDTFASRVAGSLLHAAGLAELVTDSLEEYERQALRLATHRGELQALRARLEQVATTPLFDTARFARNLESAYLALWRRFLDGQPPQALTMPKSG
jgi:predicted O-linked N-acetylglucosamine transferase (SPINDLY family)